MTTRQERNLYDRNPGTLSLKIQEMVEEGWDVDPERPMSQLGFMWECWFIRDVTDEQLQAEAEDADKLSRAEILAKARAAKAEKAKTRKENEEHE